MPTRRVEWQVRDDGSVWVIGMSLTAAHLDALRDVRYLTLYDTKVEPGLLSELTELELLELRTRSVAAAKDVRGLPRLRGLALAHNRGVTNGDIAAIGSLVGLEFLDLYALSGVTALPQMQALTRLRAVSIGQMIRLADWATLLDAPALETLELHNKLNPDLDVLRRLAARRAFRAFRWSAPDEAQRRVDAAYSAAGRPEPADHLGIRHLWQPAS